MSFASRSLFMKRGSGGHSASSQTTPSSSKSSSYGAHQNGGRRGEEEEEEGSSVRGEKEEEELMMVEKRNPVARAMSSSIGLLATAGLFIYGFGMMYGQKESVLERWRMTRSP